MNNRRKGSTFEFSIQNWMKAHKVNFFRIALSGQLAGLKGDFRWTESGKEFKGEAKCGKQIPSWLYKTLGTDECDFLVVKRDRKQRLWILTDALLEELL